MCLPELDTDKQHPKPYFKPWSLTSTSPSGSHRPHWHLHWSHLQLSLQLLPECLQPAGSSCPTSPPREDLYGSRPGTASDPPVGQQAGSCLAHFHQGTAKHSYKTNPWKWLGNNVWYYILTTLLADFLGLSTKTFIPGFNSPFAKASWS